MPSQAPVQQLRIDFGMILPTKFGLEQFLEMTKALKHRGQVHEASSQSIQQVQDIQTTNKENQQPDSLMQPTSQMSQHNQITRNTQTGNISLEQMATLLGSDDCCVDLETSSSFSTHFNDICVITLG